MATAATTIDVKAFNLNIDQPGSLRPQSSGSGGIGATLLHQMAREGDVLTAEILLEAGADVDLPDAEGKRPLHEAAFFNQPAMVRFFVEAGADIHAPVMPFGHTALTYAVKRGHAACVKELIARGANISVTDRLTGQGPLHMAAQQGSLVILGYLIAAGIDVLAEDRSGRTARDIAAENGHRAAAQVLLKVMMHRAGRYH